MAEGADTPAVQAIIDQLKHDDCQVRTIATGRLTTVAAALGPERTREELLSFLNGERPLQTLLLWFSLSLSLMQSAWMMRMKYLKYLLCRLV
jgi:hypothetical protein